MKKWCWLGCRRNKAAAVNEFLAEYDTNWAPPAAPVPVAPAPTSNAGVPSFMQGMDFLLPAPAVPPPGPVPLTPVAGNAAAPAVKSEAQKYLDTEFAVSFTTGSDILHFWRTHENQYPHLAKMARQFLGCPASSASVERIFSVAGQFYDDLRRGLGDDKLEELMWAAINKGFRRKE